MHPPPPQSSPPLRRRRRLALVGAGLVVVAGVSGLVAWQAGSISDTLDPSDARVGSAAAEPQGESSIAAATQAQASPSAMDLLPADAAPALRAFVDPDSGNRLPNDFQYQVPAVEGDALQAVVAVLRNRAEGDTIRHEAANLLRRSGYADLEQVLVACLEHPEETERFRSWAVQHLFMVYEERKDDDPAAASALLVPLLNDPQPAVRREALLSLHRLDVPNGPDVVSTAGAWLDDPATADLALRILRENDARSYTPQARAILVDEAAPQPARIAAIVTLSAWNDTDSRPAIEQLAQLPDQPANFRLRRSAQMALERMQ